MDDSQTTISLQDAIAYINDNYNIPLCVADMKRFINQNGLTVFRADGKISIIKEEIDKAINK